MISVIGVTIGTAALIIVLSVFNGFENLILRLYNSFDPDIKITKVEGKSFHLDSFPLQELRSLNGVLYVTEVLEENALVKYRDKQTLVSIKGVSDEFEKMTGLDTMMSEGKFLLKKADPQIAEVSLMQLDKYLLNTYLRNPRDRRDITPSIQTSAIPPTNRLSRA